MKNLIFILFLFKSSDLQNDSSSDCITQFENIDMKNGKTILLNRMKFSK
jgi:hypothetical protein